MVHNYNNDLDKKVTNLRICHASSTILIHMHTHGGVKTVDQNEIETST